MVELEALPETMNKLGHIIISEFPGHVLPRYIHIKEISPAELVSALWLGDGLISTVKTS